MSNLFSKRPFNIYFINTASFLLLLSCVFGSTLIFADSAISARAGTLGLGLEYELGITENFSVRLGYNDFSVDETVNESGVSYDADLNLSGITAIADYHILETRLRVSAGLVSNNNSLDLVGVPESGTFEINNVTYSAADVGQLNGSIGFSSLAPYVGIGWGNPTNSSSPLTFNFDVGVLFSGDAEADLFATCNPTLPAAACTEIQNNVAIEAEQLQTDLDGFEYYPVVMLGFSFRF